MLEAAHRHLDGYTYKLAGPDLEKHETNCCIATEQIIQSYFGIAFTRQEHADLMILDAARPWSPMDAIISAGLGHSVRSPVPGRWHLMQTWRSLDPLRSGHAKLFYEAPSPIIDGGLVVQATYDMEKSFLPIDFAGATKGLLWRMVVLRER